jgi:hypothetical protein
MIFSSNKQLKQVSQHPGSGLRFTLGSAVVVAILALMFISPAMAEGEDLSDNDTCLECHSDTERSVPADSDRPRVHNDDGSMIQEDHEMWSCIDCHTYIAEIPHADDVMDKEVDCLECHDEVPGS